MLREKTRPVVTDSDDDASKVIRNDRSVPSPSPSPTTLIPGISSLSLSTNETRFTSTYDRSKVIRDNLYMPDGLEYELRHMPTFPADVDTYFLASHQPPSIPDSSTSLTPGISSPGLTTGDTHFTSTSFEPQAPGAGHKMMPNDRIKLPRIQTDLPAYPSTYSPASTQSSWLPNFLRLNKSDDCAPTPTLFRNTDYEDTVGPSALRVEPHPGCGRLVSSPVEPRPRFLSVYRRRRDVATSAGYSHSVFNSPGAVRLHAGTSEHDPQAVSPVVGSEVNSFLESLLFSGLSFETSADGGMTQIELEDGGVLGPGFEFTAGDTGNVQRRTIASDDVLKASRKRRKDPGEGEFKCHICSQDFTARHDLTNHINAHRGIKPFECPHCRKHYTTKHVLDRHMKTAVGCKKEHAFRHRDQLQLDRLLRSPPTFAPRMSQIDTLPATFSCHSRPREFAPDP